MSNQSQSSTAPQTKIKQTWWKETFVYQIYPRSFKDSNGDGIGDLPGITQSLDYLKSLGVETLWLSPIFKSPNDDNGYDVSDYCDIMDEFGTMDDFDEMLREIKKRDMRLLLDLVANHSSDEHRWFQEARQSKDNPYRDYYIWHEGKDGQVPNNWMSWFGGSAWEYNEATQDYYLHLFSKKQPDLNWENPQLRQEIYKAMRFWLDKGVDGFRMDVIPLISKRPGFPDIPQADNPMLARLQTYANGPRIHEFLQEMHREVIQHYDIFTVGEGIGVFSEHAPDYVGERRKELHTVYYFDHMFIDRDFKTGQPFRFRPRDLKQVIKEWDQALKEEGWNTFYLGNHDQPRLVSRFGDDGKYHQESAKMLASLLLTLPAIPFLYQGDEIGMTNLNFQSPEDFNDIQTVNEYQEFKEKGGEDEDFLQLANQLSRDHSRTPFQWSDAPQAGFTEGEPWLKINENYRQINAQAAQEQENSIWHFYQKMIALRKNAPVLIYGDYQDLDPEHDTVYAFTRTYQDQIWLILLNMSEQSLKYALPEKKHLENRVIGNYENTQTEENHFHLKPYEAVIYKLENA